MKTQAVSYIRVSTRKQGESGLGLEAQQAAVDSYVTANGVKLLTTYREVESGKANDRPELHKALAHCRRSGCTLIVAKMDRLSRCASFLLALRDSGVDFVAVDNPHANALTVGILAVVAEDEARRISERTRAALQAYKARGGKLGGALPQCRNLTQEAREKGAQRAGEAVHKAAQETYADLLPVMKQWRTEGLTLDAIAGKLNADGHTTRRGKPWGAGHVHSVMQRAG
jgi:DNA invertase Pin-like site-specific DNA recombinase